MAEPLHIVEPTLADATGHCFSFLNAVCRHAGDYPITVWGGREAQVELAPKVVVRRFFRRRIRKLQAWWLYRRLLREPVRIFVSTAGRTDLMLLDWASRGRIGPRKVFLYVHWLRASPSKLSQLSRLAARQPEMVILASTQAVFDACRSAGFRHIALLPYPMSQGGAASAGGTAKFRHVLYAGAARPDKGFAEVVDLVESLVKQGGDVPVKLQTSAQHYEKMDKATFNGVRRLQASGYAHLECISRTLAPDEYDALFAGAICLQLYSRPDFADRVSGVTLDALRHGSPIVTLSGTWMARVAQEFGAGEVLEEPAPEAVLDAIQKIRRAYGEYHARALKAATVLSGRHDASAIFRAVTS